ncbi:unnamed protein product [Miscanthus lutarioriparius]|uniref:Protein kinase domain-containing protein n=1 Tax=Miscanthus lutarioriparius TaxID=422564 RepID=A0A811SLY5_9POAL|nr:unnamed protein product [Miscanthus lutarioriparius]
MSATAQPWGSLFCCVNGGAVSGEDDGPSPPRRRRGSRSRRRDRGERLLLLPSSTSASRVSLSSLSSSGTLTPEDLSVTLSGSNLHAFTYAELRAVTGGFSRANYLGSGGFGPVYRGRVDAGLRKGLDAQQIAVGAARGLAFLHDADTPVIYRDFKASNILLDEDYNTKLSDFGLAKDGPQGDATHVTTRVMGTNGYAAPEYIMTGHLTAKSDVYSFGVVLLELLTGRRSVDRARRPREQSLVDWARPYLRKPDKLYRVMDPAMECQYSCRGAERAAMVAYKCLSQNPKSRPTMREVVQSLEPVLDMDDYLQIGPFVFTVVVEDGDGKSNDGGEGKVVDGEKVDVTIETTVEEKKQHQMSHQDRHRQKFPNSAVHADVVLHYRDGGELGPHISALRRHRRTSSYVKERGA